MPFFPDSQLLTTLAGCRVGVLIKKPPAYGQWRIIPEGREPFYYVSLGRWFEPFDRKIALRPGRQLTTTSAVISFWLSTLWIVTAVPYSQAKV